MVVLKKSLLWLAASVAFGAAVFAQTITEFPLPEGSRPEKIVADDRGGVWFTETATPSIGRITATGALTVFPIEGPLLGLPSGIAMTTDGNVWFTEADDGRSGIVRMTPAGDFTRRSLFGLNIPFGIAAGSDETFWLALAGGDNVSSAAIGYGWSLDAVAIFEIPGSRTQPFGSIPADITVGPNGNAWFTEAPAANRIGTISPEGQIAEFTIPTPSSVPGGIALGPDGNLWFTETNAEKIGRITLSGDITEFPVPTSGIDIAAGPDGALWFTEHAARLGRITTSGAVTEFPIPVPAGSLTTGPENVWFTGAGSIWRLTLLREPAIDSRVLPVVGSTAGAGGSVYRTLVELRNPSSRTSTSGRIVFHPSGVPGSDSDPAVFFALPPGGRRSIGDLVESLGRFGLGSADIEVSSGSMPTAIVRVYHDGGARERQLVVNPLRSEDALNPARPGSLRLPADLASFRFNLGVRTLDGGATATLTLRDSGGAVVTTVARDFEATYHEQQSANAFLGALSLPPGGFISIELTSGAAIFYGATVDNATGDATLEIAGAMP